MQKNITIALAILLAAITWASCKKDLPVDEDGLLITTRKDCYVSSFELLGTDYVSVRVGTALVDTTAQTVKVTVQFGTDLKNLYPQFTLAQDCKLDPRITGKTDFSDTLHPRQWTVVSGDRQVRKPYKVMVSVQPR
jgi:histidinol phosphatase-like enzyme